MVAQLCEAFKPEGKWHEVGETYQIAIAYRHLLGEIVRDNPHLEPCVVHCCQCSIPFLTHPCNEERTDMRCPFGCRDHHRRMTANERSREYYQSDAGKRKKMEANARRYRDRDDTEIYYPCQPLKLEFEKNLVDYLVLIIRLTERRPVYRDEIENFLRRLQRQRSLAIQQSMMISTEVH